MDVLMDMLAVTLVRIMAVILIALGWLAIAYK